MNRRQYDPARERRDREKLAKAEALREQEIRADLQHVMKQAQFRRLLAEFLAQMGVDGSQFSTNAMAQSHSIGLRDAGMWWLGLVRVHCPEKEAIMRAEHAKIPPVAEDDEDENDEH